MSENNALQLNEIKEQSRNAYNLLSNVRQSNEKERDEINLEGVAKKEYGDGNSCEILHSNYRSTVLRIGKVCMKRYTEYRVNSLKEIRGKDIVKEEIDTNNLLRNKDSSWMPNEPPEFYGFIPHPKKYNTVLLFRYIQSKELEEYLRRRADRQIIEQIYRTLKLEGELFSPEKSVEVTEEKLKNAYPELERFMSFDLDEADIPQTTKMDLRSLKERIDSLRRKVAEERGMENLVCSRADPEASNFLVDSNGNLRPIDFAMMQKSFPTFSVGYFLSHDKPEKNIPRQNFRKLKKTMTRKELERNGEFELFKLSVLNGYWGPSTRILEKGNFGKEEKKRELLENIEKSRLLFRSIKDWLEW